VTAIRAWIAKDPAAQTGWLGALRDPQIGHATSLIHQHPARLWTLASPAAEVAMSRSAFPARFTQIAGERVRGYLTRWRMHLARDQLVHGMPPSAIKQHGETTGLPPA
jgi:AraC-like DNA-binding protein